MAIYTLTNQAKSDIESILMQGIDGFGISQALAYIDELENVFILLAQNPKIGRIRTEINPLVRVHPFFAHVILYEQTRDEEILILTLRSSKENWLK